VAEVEVMVDVAVKASWPMEPRTGSDEDTATIEPIRAVITGRCAGIGRNLVIAVGANRRPPTPTPILVGPQLTVKRAAPTKTISQPGFRICHQNIGNSGGVKARPVCHDTLASFQLAM
jgi:hypothetical protein